MKRAIDCLDVVEMKRAFPDLLGKGQHATVQINHEITRLIDLLPKTKDIIPVNVSWLTGKLEGLAAVSTTCVINPYCLQAMNDPESPCYHCFAASIAAQYNSMREWAEHNYTRLNTILLDQWELHYICKQLSKSANKFVRIEYAGDIGTDLQVQNYINLVNIGKDYGLYFGIWSKRPEMWEKGFDLYGKPENCTFILSACGLDQIDEPKHHYIKYMDCIFIVCKHAAQTAAAWIENGYKVHYCKCENGSCASKEICGYCYQKYARQEISGSVTIIMEDLR